MNQEEIDESIIGCGKTMNKEKSVRPSIEIQEMQKRMQFLELQIQNANQQIYKVSARVRELEEPGERDFEIRLRRRLEAGRATNSQTEECQSLASGVMGGAYGRY